MAKLRRFSSLLRCEWACGVTLVCALLLPCAAHAQTGITGRPVWNGVPASASAPAQQAAQQASARTAAAAQATVDVQSATAHNAAVQDLIATAEASYNSGVTDYNANKLDAARADFDAAVDVLLTSGMDLKNDPVLSDEFERLISAINSLELVALKQGNGFSPVLEAAPVDEAAEVTFAPDPMLVKQVTAQLQTTKSQLPLVINDYVAGWISAYTNKPGLHSTLLHALQRAGKYKDMIQRVLRENDVPEELIYQAVTESGFQPQALNRKSGCAGMWQFQPSVESYGLVKNGYFDERFDPEKSTIAYAKYIKTLYKLFGDWYLAMAAYDWGPGRVQHVVSRTGYADYWQLYEHSSLPAETKAYIPSVIAAIIMAKNPAQYGLSDLVQDAPVLSDTVTTDYAIDLRLAADVTNSTVQEIVTLNPALLRLQTPRDLSYDLHLPPGTKLVYLDRLKDIPREDRASWRFHVVKPGETLAEIATNLHAHAAEIAEYNEVKPSQPLEEGDELVVPIAASLSAGQNRYTVHRADTLVTVADRFGVTVEQLRDWNRIAGTKLTPGRSLYVAEPIRLAPMGRSARARRGHTRSMSSTRRGSARSSGRAARSTTGARKSIAGTRRKR